MRLIFAPATDEDAPELARLRIATAAALTGKFGRGHWSGETSERAVIAGMRQSYVWVARRGESIVGTFRLARKKPWAIDKSYFAPSRLPLYLTDMAVFPPAQGRGIGRMCLDRAVRAARDLGGDAIRLDAYDDVAGAGEFYEKCGFREVGRASFRGVPLIYYELIVPAT